MPSTSNFGKIKPLCKEDLSGVVAIDKAMTGVARSDFFKKRLDAALEKPGDYVYVGLHSGDCLVGYAMAKLVNGEFGNPGASASLDAMTVDPVHQGKGGGHQLLKAVEGVLSHKGVEKLTSQVDWSSPAMLGFLVDSGFDLAPRIVLTRDTITPPSQLDFEQDDEYLDEIDFSAPDGDDPGALSNERIPIRSMNEADLADMIAIDKKISDTDRTAYFKRKQQEVLHQSGVRVSLIAEMDDHPVGYIMARVDYGEFGRTSATAVMDTIGVDPGYSGQGIGQELMYKLLANLSILHVEKIRTEVDWNTVSLIAYLDEAGFKPAQTIVVSKKV